MFNKIMSFAASSLMIGLTIIFMAFWYFNFDNLNMATAPVFWMVLFTFIFPILSYVFYLKSNLNKGVAFICAFLTSATCYCIYALTYHFRTDFKYWEDSETQLLFSLLVLCILAITLIFGIVYFVVWWRQKSK